MKTKYIIQSILALTLTLSGCVQTSHPRLSTSVVSSATRAEQAEILALFDQWNNSLATGNPRAVAANYSPKAILLPTVSNKVRRTQAERIEYFEHFLEMKPQGKINQAFIRTYGDIAINSGLYTFTLKNGASIPARYTFVYKKQPNGKWLIIEHHSSKMPE